MPDEMLEEQVAEDEDFLAAVEGFAAQAEGLAAGAEDEVLALGEVAVVVHDDQLVGDEEHQVALAGAMLEEKVTPEHVVELLEPFVELGYRHLVAAFPSPYDAETMDRLITEVRVAFISEGRARPIPKSLRTLMKADLIEG